MLQRLIQQYIKKKSNVIFLGFPPCGREPCHCIKSLNLSNIDDQKIYDECYKTWFKYKYK